MCENKVNNKQNVELLIEQIFEMIDKPAITSVQSDIEFLNLIKPIVNVLAAKHSIDIAQHKKLVDEEVVKFLPKIRMKRLLTANEFYNFQRHFDVRKILRRYYAKERIHMSYRQLFKEISSNDQFADLSHEKLKNWLIQLGFRLIIVPHEREIVNEAHYLKLARIKYLRSIQEFRKNNQNIVYFAETSIDCDRLKLAQQGDKTKVMSETNPSSSNLTFLYAANEKGLVNFAFVENQDLSQINQLNFTEWLMAVAVNLPSNSIIVLEPRPYSTPELPAIFSAPTLPTKLQIQHSLKKLSFPPSQEHVIQSIHRLWKNRSKLTAETWKQPHFIDHTMESMGFTVLRLPDKHPELNPLHIDFFAFLLNGLASLPDDLSAEAELQYLKDLIRERLDGSTEDEWRTYVENCISIENEFIRFEESSDGEDESTTDFSDENGIVVQISDDED